MDLCTGLARASLAWRGIQHGQLREAVEVLAPTAQDKAKDEMEKKMNTLPWPKFCSKNHNKAMYGYGEVEWDTASSRRQRVPDPNNPGKPCRFQDTLQCAAALTPTASDSKATLQKEWSAACTPASTMTRLQWRHRVDKAARNAITRSGNVARSRQAVTMDGMPRPSGATSGNDQGSAGACL